MKQETRRTTMTNKEEQDKLRQYKELHICFKNKEYLSEIKKNKINKYFFSTNDNLSHVESLNKEKAIEALGKFVSIKHKYTLGEYENNDFVLYQFNDEHTSFLYTIPWQCTTEEKFNKNISFEKHIDCIVALYIDINHFNSFFKEAESMYLGHIAGYETTTQRNLNICDPMIADLFTKTTTEPIYEQCMTYEETSIAIAQRYISLLAAELEIKEHKNRIDFLNKSFLSIRNLT
jgi:hypothetical protein